MIDVTSLSAYDLSQKLHSGEISSLDLCKAYLDRIKKFEKDVQAWQFLDKKLLLEKAEEADTYRKSGKPLGPLHGMPVAIHARLLFRRPRWMASCTTYSLKTVGRIQLMLWACTSWGWGKG